MRMKLPAPVAITLIAFFLTIIVVIATEIFDIPNQIFDAPATPVNWHDIGTILVFVFAIGLLTVWLLWRHIRLNERTALHNARLQNIIFTVQQINQLIIRVTTEDELCTQACTTLTEGGKYKTVWIGMVTEKSTDITVTAKSGGEIACNDIEKDKDTDEQLETNPAIGVIRTGRPVIVQDIETDATPCTWRTQTLEHGYHSFAAFPLKVSRNTIGVMSICSDEANIFDKEEIDLLDELAGDISLGVEKLRQQQAIQLSEERYRRTLDGMLEGCQIVNDDLVYQYLNDTAIQHSQLRREDLIGHRMAEVYPGIDQTEVYTWLLQCVKTKESHQMENLFQYPDGTHRWFLLSIEPIPEGLFILSVDITEQKLAESRITAERSRFKSMFDNSQNGIVIVDKENRVIDANNAFERVFGYTKNEILGKSLEGYIVPERYKDEPEKIRNMSWSQGISDFEIIRKRKDGEELNVLLSSIPIIVDGEIEGRFGFFTDITQRKQMELFIRKINRTLRSLSQCNQILVHSTEETELLDQLCHLIVEENEYRMAWIGYIDQNRQDIVHPVTSCGVENGFLTMIDAAYDESSAVRSPEQKAIVSGKPYLVQNLDTDPYFQTLHDDVTQREYGACLVLPLHSDHQTLGTISIYHQKSETFSQEEIDLLFEMANDLAYGIRSLRTRHERDIAEENLRAYLNLAPDGIYVSDINGTLLYGNKRAEEISGYSEKELVGKNFFAIGILPIEFTVKARNLLMMNAEGRSTSPEEFQLKQKNGNLTWVEISSTPINRNGGYAVIGIVRDISERKLAEEALKESEEKFRAILDNTVDGILVIDSETKDLYIGNQSISRMLGYSMAELESMSLYDIIRFNDFSYIKALFARQEKGETALSKDIPIKRKDDSIFYAEINSSSLTIGGKAYVIGIFRDTTERKKMQEQLMVTDRLASIGELAAGIAHELNNPLTGVIGYSDLVLAREDIPDDAREDLTTINSEAIRAGEVARHLLTFARKHPDEKKPVNVNDVISFVLELRAYEQRVNNIDVITRFDPDIPDVPANDFQLQQVFINIIINAEHFMIDANGKGKLTITTEHMLHMVRITISDDGPGIPEQQLTHIFDPFYTTKPVGKGTGLGLSICHGIITEHNGTIRAENNQDAGASFIIELPLN